MATETDPDVDALARETRRRLDDLGAELARLHWQQIGTAEASRDSAADAFVWGVLVGVWLAILLRVAKRIRVRVDVLDVDDLDGPAAPDVV